MFVVDSVSTDGFDTTLPPGIIVGVAVGTIVGVLVGLMVGVAVGPEPVEGVGLIVGVTVGVGLPAGVREKLSVVSHPTLLIRWYTVTVAALAGVLKLPE